MIVFDFDLTLVDTAPVEHLRNNGRWPDVMDRVPDLEVYDGVHELLADLHDRREVLAIVTDSPNMVPKALVERYRWPIGIVLAYHQVKRRKPDPEVLLPAMREADEEPGNTFHVGDRPEDTQASRAAGVAALGPDGASPTPGLWRGRRRTVCSGLSGTCTTTSCKGSGR